MSTQCEQVTEDLAAIVDGDRDVIARHAEHIASCDTCRDARHEASQIAKLVADAGSDHAATGDVVGRLMSAIDAEAPVVAAKPAPAPTPTPAPKPAPVEKKVDRKVVSIESARRRRPWLAIGAAAAAAAAVATTGGYLATRHGNDDTAPTTATSDGSIGKLATVTRAAADKVDGVSTRTGNGAWHPLREHESLVAGSEVKTDERTRTAIDLADGTHVVLDHLTTVAFDRAEARHMKLTAGRIVADVAHVENHPASIVTPSGTIDVVGTRFEVTATDALTSVQVVRGEIVLHDNAGGHESVRAGEEGLIDHGALSVSPAPSLSKEVSWSELMKPTTSPDETTAGLGALRAYKPGESRDRDWKLALAKHDVKVRIVGPIARTEITEVFRNDSNAQLEGVYQFPLPADAQIDGLSLDVNGGFVDGAFVDKTRAAKIWRGVIDRARPIEQRATTEIVWVPGPWRDPALLDWKRGGRFELHIFPIPAKGSRTIKLAYTQVVTPRGPWRQYIYPLPHSSDGSTVADTMTVDVEVRGAANGLVRAAGYPLTADPARKDLNAMTFSQGGFVPRGDLVVDYRAADGDSELRAWTFTGGAAVAPDEKLINKKNVGIDPKVVEAQRLVAGDARPTAVLALQPKLPRWRESKPRDYVIVLDDSQSMVGERWKRASELALAMVNQMDRRDRFTTVVCDSECRSYGAVRAPSASAASELKSWLATTQVAGASDLVASIRSAANELTDGSRERWVLYVGDGFASTGFRKSADIEQALADSTLTKDIHVTTIGIGSDVDEPVLTAAARGGGGAYLAWLPGQTVGNTAVATLESTYGATLRDAKLELPAGLVDSAPTVLPTIRAGQEVLLAARITGDVSGEVVLKGMVAGQPFEQRYPLKLSVSGAAGNGFVPRLWASLMAEQLEAGGKGEDRAKIVALSQGYGVMSRETSLLVLESQAMFDAFGVDHNVTSAKWTGEDSLDEVASSGLLGGAVTGQGMGGTGTGTAVMPATGAKSEADFATRGEDLGKASDKPEPSAKKMPDAKPKMVVTTTPVPPPPPAQQAPAMGHANNGLRSKDGMGGGGFAAGDDFGGGRAMPRNMIAMRKVWTRIAAVSAYDGVNDSIKKSVAEYEEALAKNPDSREKHRALVQALSYAGELDKARDVANKWLERDRLDPQALGYIADLTGRNGERDQSLRILAGLVDLDADKVALHERMVNAYERTGRLAQACGHRIAIASIQTKDTGSAASAARCLRTLGRDGDASLVMRGLPDDASRASAEKLATVAPTAPKLAGDLVVNAKWDSGADLDVSLVTPDGTRVSWMGGRSDVIVNDSTSTERESLAVRSLRRGNYLVEITRGDAARSTVHGSLDVTVLGVKKTLPFELTGTHGTVGRIAVTLESHLEPVDGGIGSQNFNPMPPTQPRVAVTNIPDETANRVVKARAGIYRACYQRELNRVPNTSGRVSLVVAIDDQGIPTVQRTSPAGTNMDAVGQCLSQSISRLHFPAGEAKTFAVQMSFTPN